MNFGVMAVCFEDSNETFLFSSKGVERKVERTQLHDLISTNIWIILPVKTERKY